MTRFNYALELFLTSARAKIVYVSTNWRGVIVFYDNNGVEIEYLALPLQLPSVGGETPTLYLSRI